MRARSRIMGRFLPYGPEAVRRVPRGRALRHSRACRLKVSERLTGAVSGGDVNGIGSGGLETGRDSTTAAGRGGPPAPLLRYLGVRTGRASYADGARRR